MVAGFEVQQYNLDLQIWNISGHLTKMFGQETHLNNTITECDGAKSDHLNTKWKQNEQVTKSMY
jgi:hypothetical protein